MVTKKKTQMRGRGQGGIATTLTAKQRKILRKYGPYRLDDDGEIRDSNDMVLWSIVPGVMDVDHALVAALNAAIEEPGAGRAGPREAAPGGAGLRGEGRGRPGAQVTTT